MKVCLFADARSVHVHQLVQALISRGAVVHVVTHKPAEIPGARVERFSVPRPGLLNLRRWKSRYRVHLRGYLRRFDIVNIHFLSDWGFGAWIADEPDRRAAVVATAWGSDVVDPPAEKPASLALRAARIELLRAADAVTVCGPTFADTVAGFASMDAERIDVLPFGVDLQRFDPKATPAAGPGEDPVVGFFKGFRAVYGPCVMIRAIPKVLAQVPAARFEMIGDGPEHHACRSLARELGVDSRITWVGRLDHRLLPPRLARWNVSVIPSIHEAFGVAALESSAMGVPVVASDVCGLRDTVEDGQTGIRVPLNNLDALAGAVVRMLQDRDLRRRLGEAGRRMVENHYDWRSLAPRWIAYYERVHARVAAGARRDDAANAPHLVPSAVAADSRLLERLVSSTIH